MPLTDLLFVERIYLFKSVLFLAIFAGRTIQNPPSFARTTLAKQHCQMEMGSLALMPKTIFLSATNGSRLPTIAHSHVENAICKVIRRSVKIAMAKQCYRMGLGSLVSKRKIIYHFAENGKKFESFVQ